MFDKFSWPFLKDATLKIIENGMTPVFHLDTNWDREMERFLELPKGKCIVETDGASNIFRAKEILKDHVCLAGDVLPALLVTGSATETTEYCKKLIDVVGKDGGYIFSNGCTMPVDSRHENVKAMMDTIARYGRYD
jgi:uroporphyrinogen decarboxylase